MKGSRGMVLAMLALALIVSSGAQASFVIEGGPLQWVLEGKPSSSRPVEYVGLRLIRVGEERRSLYFRLSELHDDQGNEFPLDLIVLRTPYDSDEQRWENVLSERCLLAADDDYVDLKLGVRYSEVVVAGTYRGSLLSDAGEEVPLEVVVQPFTDVTLGPATIRLDALAGPGLYRAAEPAQISVRANHVNWIVNVNSGGLFRIDDQNRVAVQSEFIPLFFVEVRAANEPSGRENLRLQGEDYGREALITFEVQAYVGWGHPAGTYGGVINVDVEVGD